MRTVAALFDDYEDARRTVHDLEAAGYPSDDISIVVNNAGDRYSGAGAGAGAGAGLGAVSGGAAGLLAGLGLMAVPGVGPVVAAGWLVSTATGAATGAVVGGAVGGIIESLTDAGIAEEDAHLYAEGIRRGGALVTVRVDDSRAAQADGIMRNRNAVDISVRRRAYVEQGWTEFDSASPPFSLDDVDRERESHGRTTSP